MLFGAVAGLILFTPSADALNVERLEPDEERQLHSILDTLRQPIAEARARGDAARLDWSDLYEPLTEEQQAFLNTFRQLRGAVLGATSHYFGEAEGAYDIVAVPEQRIEETPGAFRTIDTQYLPRTVLVAYDGVLAAMDADLGRRLLVESGYRSPAYQLYLFLYYLPGHDHSIRETNRFVALPGHSEHGHPPRQAIDFINENGISGEDRPEEFEGLPEYRWLQEHAGEYGFHLSYPRDNPYNTAFEPWHWHYEEP